MYPSRYMLHKNNFNSEPFKLNFHNRKSTLEVVSKAITDLKDSLIHTPNIIFIGGDNISITNKLKNEFITEKGYINGVTVVPSNIDYEALLRIQKLIVKWN